jgi:hypothetical protein
MQRKEPVARTRFLAASFMKALFALSSDQAHLVSYWPARLVP